MKYNLKRVYDRSTDHTEKLDYSFFIISGFFGSLKKINKIEKSLFKCRPLSKYAQDNLSSHTYNITRSE